MEYIYFEIIAAAIIIALLIFAGIAIYKHIVDTKVLESSQKIANLLSLNKRTSFHKITDQFRVSKRYDNKNSYNKIEPGYLMAAKIRENLPHFSDYVSKIRENRDKKAEYIEEVQKILSTQYRIDYHKLGITREIYIKHEAKLFSERILHPTVDCTFTVCMSYSSPKQKVNLSKVNVFDFNDLVACLESVSLSRLDKKTHSMLTSVERGEVSDSLRYDILSRDNFTCVICGASAKQGVRLHVDHILPVSKGGKSEPSNLRTLCERCNIGKSNKIESINVTTTHTTATTSRLNNDQICRNCGAKLVLRESQYGKFYGCSNYPNCKFTKNINS